jgi:hypothetical protein
MKIFVIANKVKQSMTPDCMDCHAAARRAMTTSLHHENIWHEPCLSSLSI